LGTSAMASGLPPEGRRSVRSAPAPAVPPSGEQEFLAEWAAFRARFVTPDGRVVDTGNGGVSHSEGQSCGLLFAAAADDRASFERILAWSRGALRRPEDSLMAWRYRPGAAVPVDDPSNATDGDLVFAWALLRVGGRRGVRAHRDLARAIAGDVVRKLVRHAGGRTVLFPAAVGFEHPGRLIVNPSYQLGG